MINQVIEGQCWAMMGMVLWSDLDEKKAVFWCEDQGDLAFFDGKDEVSEAARIMRTGDMVQFDVMLESKIRRAKNARVIQSSVCNGLQDELRKSAALKDEEISEAGSGDLVQLCDVVANSPVGKRVINS